MKPSSIPLPRIPTYTPSIMVPSLSMSVPPMSLPTSQPSFHSIPYTYLSPLPTMVPIIPLVMSSICVASYTLPNCMLPTVVPNLIPNIHIPNFPSVIPISSHTIMRIKLWFMM